MKKLNRDELIEAYWAVVADLAAEVNWEAFVPTARRLKELTDAKRKRELGV